jgi:3-methylcrotonyl-CoA carboxylase alpha subunit
MGEGGFGKLLIANRGEIAVRVARTAARLGLGTVAVYSDADRAAAHVEACDEAVHIGASPARDSYLRIDALIDAARATGAEAIHPGYGFLAENAAFAAACARAGITFVGPPAAVIEAMGSKAAARELARRAGVPVATGYAGEEQSAAALRRQAAEIGYPLLIKPVSGGGGKGMHRVDDAASFDAALAAAQREAQAAFGDERVLLERFIMPARHVEVQVLADAHGHCLHLFDRDCSAQRRHQKLLEEAPAPGIPGPQRAALHAAAVACARAAGYVNAGTVEFLYGPDGAFYFMEMNTRLQVEHGVTELVTGLDLVEWQLRIAAGEALPFSQQDLAAVGHAIEVRLCAENAARDFLPSAGRIRHLSWPRDGGVRVDSGIRAGDEVTPYYDSLLAKLMVHAPTRTQAIARLRQALRQCAIVGVDNNRILLAALAATPELAQARIDTGFIEREHGRLLGPPSAARPEACMAVALARLLRRAPLASPWSWPTAWRLNGPAAEQLTLHDGSQPRVLQIEPLQAASAGRCSHYCITLDEATDVRVLRTAGDVLELEIAGRERRALVVEDGEGWHVFLDGQESVLRLVDPLRRTDTAASTEHSLRAPMPGRVVAVHVVAGTKVERGAPLLVIEAMKMDHVVTAPARGEVAAVHFAVGDQVGAGVELLEFTAAPAAAADKQP